MERMAVDASGLFRIASQDGISWHCCCLLQWANGYDYGKVGKHIPPTVEAIGFLQRSL